MTVNLHRPTGIILILVTAAWLYAGDDVAGEEGEASREAGQRLKAISLEDLTPEEREDLGAQYFERREYGIALEPLESAAMMGRAKAQYILGRMYQAGLGVAKAEPEAARWYTKAVRRGYLPAYASLAYLFRMGGGVEQNLEEAFRLSRIAAEAGNARAQVELGRCYFLGKFDEREGPSHDQLREAEIWLRRAAGQGDRDGQYTLANLFSTRGGKLIQSAGIQGFSQAQPLLSQLRIEEYKWAILALKQGVHDSLRYGPITDTNSWAQMTTDERLELAEALRRATEFVPRKENTNEWLARIAPNPSFSEPDSTGTGFFISEDGFLLTNFHVVEDAMQIIVRYGSRTYPATLVRADALNDLALLKVSGKFSVIRLGISRVMKLGDSVFTVGFPNPQLQGVAPKLTDGKISSLSGAKDDARHFQISVAVQPGNSGGALVNTVGNVVGVVTARLSDAAALKTSGVLPQNVNYAIKSSYVLALIESLPEVMSKIQKPWPANDRRFEDVVREAQEAAALVLVY